MSYTSRRGFLTTMAGALLLVAAPTLARAEAAVEPTLLRSTRDDRGITFFFQLAHAPFPAPGAGYTDSTVIVFVPNHLRRPRSGRTSALVHFHGHSTTAERALDAHRLREQLVDSKQDAILVLPQGPVMAQDSSIGKLEVEGGLARLLGDVFRALHTGPARAALGRTSVGTEADRVCLSAHSGGYHAAAKCVKHGGVEVNEVYLFDALYADADVFRDWVVAGKGRSQRERHKLVTYFTGGATERWSEWLFAELGRAGVVCAREHVEGTLSREELTRAEAVAIRSSLAHGDVTNQWNSLRDCLYASALPRHLRTSWFDAKHGARPIERRR